MVAAPSATEQGSDADREFMRLALALAERGRGRTSPNPVVGCVIVSPDGVIVGAGHHERAGGPHAEVNALGRAGARASGATLYCTLEPCAHRGRTGPCVEAIVGAGIRRVVGAVTDPNPLVAGRGFAYLRVHGVDVTEGVRQAEAAGINAAFFTAVTLGRPHVTAKIATSLDARVAVRSGARTALTSAEANRRVHLVRAEVDAIAVGSETVLVDDPLLTVREVYRARPFVRVVFDRRLRTPATARLFTTLNQGPVWVCTTEAARDANPGSVDALTAAGAETIVTPGGSLVEALRELGRRELRSLLLEGGPTLQAAAWQARVIDRWLVLVAPHILGPAGVPWSMPASLDLAALAPRVEPVGPDVLLEADVHWTH